MSYLVVRHFFYDALFLIHLISGVTRTWLGPSHGPSSSSSSPAFLLCFRTPRPRAMLLRDILLRVQPLALHDLHLLRLPISSGGRRAPHTPPATFIVHVVVVGIWRRVRPRTVGPEPWSPETAIEPVPASPRRLSRGFWVPVTVLVSR